MIKKYVYGLSREVVMEERMRFILSSCDFERMNFENDNYLTINVHGLSLNKMTRLLKNISCINRNNFTMRIIHGFNHGTRLKDSLRTKGLFTRDYLIMPDKVNPGVTMIVFY